MPRDKRRHVIVSRIAPTPASEADGDARAAADASMRRAVEDHRDRLVARGSKRFEPVDEPALRRLPIAPPAIGPGAHDVVAVDDPLGHGMPSYHA